MEFLNSSNRPKTGLFRLIEDGHLFPNGDKCRWYYQMSTNSWTSNPDGASLMPKSIAEMYLEKFNHHGNMKIEFVPQTSGVNIVSGLCNSCFDKIFEGDKD